MPLPDPMRIETADHIVRIIAPAMIIIQTISLGFVIFLSGQQYHRMIPSIACAAANDSGLVPCRKKQTVCRGDDHRFYLKFCCTGGHVLQRRHLCTGFHGNDRHRDCFCCDVRHKRGADLFGCRHHHRWNLHLVGCSGNFTGKKRPRRPHFNFLRLAFICWVRLFLSPFPSN